MHGHKSLSVDVSFEFNELDGGVGMWGGDGGDASRVKHRGSSGVDTYKAQQS